MSIAIDGPQASPPPPSRWADLFAGLSEVLDGATIELRELVHSTPGQRYARILSELHGLKAGFSSLEAHMGQIRDSFDAAVAKLTSDSADLPNRIAAAVAAATKPKDDQIVALTAANADLTAQVATLQASAGDALTADDVSALGTIDGTINTASPPVSTP